MCSKFNGAAGEQGVPAASRPARRRGPLHLRPMSYANCFDSEWPNRSKLLLECCNITSEEHYVLVKITRKDHNVTSQDH